MAIFIHVSTRSANHLRDLTEANIYLEWQTLHQMISHLRDYGLGTRQYLYSLLLDTAYRRETYLLSQSRFSKKLIHS